MKEITKSSIWHEYGALALASRLKKLSDLLFQQVEALYVQHGIAVSSRYFPILVQLSQQEPLCVSEIAERLDLSHPAIVQTINLMKRDMLVVDHVSPADSRRSDLYLSEKGRQMVKKLDPIWMQLWKVINQLLIDHAPSLLSQLDQLESQLSKQSLAGRFFQEELHPSSGAQILCWDPKYHAAFVDLNEEWLKTYFAIEDEDRRILDFAEREIIEPGGMIFFARQKGLIAGTCALIRIDKTTYELAKMAVAPDLRGHGIGKSLLEYAITWAKSKNAKRITLESSTKLEAALSLYGSFGFTKVTPKHASAFKRVDIAMELLISK